MAPNNNTKSVDTMLNELDGIFKSHYLGYKNHKEPYKEIITAVGVYKNAREKKDLLIALQNKFDSNETFLNLESSLWGGLFIIVGLFITMISDLILSNFEKLPSYNATNPEFYVAFVFLFASILIISYCLSIRHISKKSKKKCYYKFVYDILNQ
jgi:hypothetical protein